MARLGINLTKIESRPARRQPWEYVMFVDFEGHRDVVPAATALKEIGERALFVKVLGSYPAA
jgi:prephenate dehydratase